MPRPGYTTKPCHGCGSTKEHKKETLCMDCQALLKIAEMHKEKYVRLVNDDEFEELNIPYNWEQPSYYTKRQNLARNLKYKRVGEILKELAEELSLEKGILPIYYTYYHSELQFTPEDTVGLDGGNLENIYGKKRYEYKKNAVMHKKTRALLEELHECITDSLEEVENSSVEFGKNAMLMLNAGKITLEEFNKK